MDREKEELTSGRLSRRKFTAAFSAAVASAACARAGAAALADGHGLKKAKPNNPRQKTTRQGCWSGSSVGWDGSASVAPTDAALTKVNLVNVTLREYANLAEFRTRWLPQVAQAKPAVLLVGVGGQLSTHSATISEGRGER